jgi:hypothetical protein
VLHEGQEDGLTNVRGIYRSAQVEAETTARDEAKFGLVPLPQLVKRLVVTTEHAIQQQPNVAHGVSP